MSEWSYDGDKKINTIVYRSSHATLSLFPSLPPSLSLSLSQTVQMVDKRLMDGGDEFLQLMDLCSVIMHQLCHAHS